MLQKIERDPSTFIQGDDFAVNECIGREPFAGTGDLWEPSRKEITSPRPKRDAIHISARHR